MATLLVDENDNTIFESEGIKTPVESYMESKPEFAHKLPGPDPEQTPFIEYKDDPIIESKLSEKETKYKSNNTVIIMLIIALVIVIGLMVYQNLNDTKDAK